MAPVAQPVSTVTVRYFGPTGGNAAWYYWVQALFPGGYAGLSPYGLVTQSQPSLNRDMFNVVSWDEVVGAIGYKVWRTPTATAPTTGPYMLAVVGGAGTTVTDNGINWQISTDTVEVGIDVSGNANISGSYLVNGSPITGGSGQVSSVFGRTGVVVAVTGDYSAAQITNAVDTSTPGGYSNPAWITSLDAGKLTGTPPAAVIGSVQTPWLQNINGGNFQLSNVSKIGVGTTSPNATLTVNGNVGISTTATFAKVQIVTLNDTTPSTVGAWNNRHFVVGPDGNAGGVGISYNSTSGYGVIQAIQPNVAWQNLVLQSGGGNVGIGTSSPQSSLHLGPITGADTFETIEAASGRAAYIKYNRAGYVFLAGSGMDATNSWGIYDGQASAWRFLIASSGNVGIATTSPTYKLDLSGGSVATSQLHISYDGTDKGGYLSTDSSFNFSASSGIALSGGSWTVKTANWGLTQVLGNAFAVYLGAAYALGTATLPTPTIYASGTSVGINNTSPTYNLHLVNDSAAKPTTNTWTIPSDIRLKKNVRPFTDGLQTLRRIEPIRYAYNGMSGTPANQEGVGIDAGKHAQLLPDCVGQKDGIYNFNSHALTFMLINAIRELVDRIEKLEKGK